MWQLVEVKGAQLLGHQIQRLRQGLLKFHFFYCCQVTQKIEYFHSVVSSKASRSARKIFILLHLEIFPPSPLLPPGRPRGMSDLCLDEEM